MRPPPRPTGPTLLATAAFAALLLADAAAAQLITLKTVPVATGEQFRLFPSALEGFGGAGLALHDSLGDPWTHPAKASRLGTPFLFGAPTTYGISGDNGGGRTLPAGLLAAGGAWFGGGAVALQQLEGPDPRGFVFGSQTRLSDRARTNEYVHGVLGRRVGTEGTAVGVGLLWAGLDAMDGVDLLYPLASQLDQSGRVLDLRAGVVRDGADGSSGEILLVHNRVDMTHEVGFPTWGPLVDPIPGGPVELAEKNLDRTRTWGLHLGYQRPVGDAGWRAGGILTANWKDHPKIPNYQIMNIPRDPGHSWAYNLGAGVARQLGPTKLALDLVYEPAWSETWAEAEVPVVTASGDTIPAGGKTVENDFRFSNAAIRMGVGRTQERWGFQLGVDARRISYTLDQWDAVQERQREQEEEWIEWTPTWGVVLRFPEVHLRYAGRTTTGTGRPGVAWEGVAGAADLGSDFLPAASGPLTLEDARVTSHRVSVSLPLGGR